MAKQFIRHLEFYGFPDQNGYSSEVNGISADLSEIIKKNKEQDKEIKDLTNEKANKKDLLELSGTVETLVSAQTEFNNMVVEELSGITNDINILKEIDNDYGQQLSALTDGLNDAMDAMQILGNRVDDVENNISGINETIDTIIEDYAKKDDVYSKEDIDSMIASGFSGYATQEWVEEQGYITEEEADAKYAKIEDLEDLASQVESAATNIDEKFNEIDDSIDEINDKVDTLTEDLSAFSEDVSEAISGINESINGINDSISGINDDIAEINEAVSANTADIAANTEAIEDIQEAVSGITSDIDALSAQVMTNKTNISRCADAIRQRATKDELSAVRTELKGDIENLDETKADKTDLDAVSGAVDTLSDRLTAEIAERREADRAVNETVAELNGRVTTAEGKVDGCVTKVDAIESGLTKEIADRKAADLALIGEDTDTSDADTIWGAKKKAAELATQAINESKDYTNSVVDAFEDELAELSAKTDQELSKFATQEYVDGRLTNIKTVLRSEIKNGDDAERDARIAGDAALDDKISTLSDSLAEEIEVINKNSTILNAFTDWDGEGAYDDSGNGIVDIMHREIHDLKPEGIEEIKAQVSANTTAIQTEAADRTQADEELDSKITREISAREQGDAELSQAIEGLATTEYVNSEIERVEEEIPSLDTVYTKEEVDELLAAKDAEIEELQAEYNRLRDMVLDLYYTTTYSVPTDCSLETMLKSNNGEAKLTEDITTGTIAPGTTAKNIVNLKLNGKNITFTGSTTNNPAIMVRNKQQLTIINKGTIDAGGRIAIEANGADCVVTLGGQTMLGARPTYVTDRSGGELIYCYEGTINITNGVFKNLGEDKTYLLNCYDANYRNGTAKIVVTGGSFYDFNPADNNAEGAHTSFVPAGYHVEESTDGDSTVYTVKAD